MADIETPGSKITRQVLGERSLGVSNESDLAALERLRELSQLLEGWLMSYTHVSRITKVRGVFRRKIHRRVDYRGRTTVQRGREEAATPNNCAPRSDVCFQVSTNVLEKPAEDQTLERGLVAGR